MHALITFKALGRAQGLGWSRCWELLAEKRL